MTRIDPTTNPPPEFCVKFRGGPFDGQTRAFAREAPTYRMFTWTYEATGRRDGDYWVYVKRPSNSAFRRLLVWIIQRTGKDPRLDDRPQPFRVPHRGRNQKCYCGSGKKYKHCHART